MRAKRVRSGRSAPAATRSGGDMGRWKAPLHTGTDEVQRSQETAETAHPKTGMQGAEATCVGACAQETGHPTLAVPSDCSHRHLECQQHVEEAQAHAWGQRPCTVRRGVAAAGLSTARLGPRGEASSERAPPPHPHTRPQRSADTATEHGPCGQRGHASARGAGGKARTHGQGLAASTPGPRDGGNSAGASGQLHVWRDLGPPLAHSEAFSRPSRTKRK